MGERKVLNKYYSPDFDPKKIPRIQKPKNGQKKIRTMLAFSMRCNTCGNYMSEGTKFNCLEEQVIDETYLDIKIHRFYIKCSNCCAELIYKTDPQNHDYAVESGGTRLHEQHKEVKQVEENVSAMTSLEKRSLVSKREIDVMAALDEMKSMKSRRKSVSVDSMLEALSRRNQEEEEAKEEEEALLVKSIRFGEQKKIATEEINETKPKRRDCGKPSIKISNVRVITSKKKTSMGLASLCQNYGSDEEN